VTVAVAAGRSDTEVSLLRRMTAEGLGTGFLVAAVIGSGIAATRLSPGQPGLQLLENALATGAVLTAMILALHPVSAAFNPVVVLVERADGLVSSRDAVGLVGAQVAGAASGAVVANVMFDLPPVTVSSTARGGVGLWVAEVVATIGLVIVAYGAGRSGSADSARLRVALAVGAYITAAYWFTSSTSFANPAVTLARMLSDTFAGIAPASVPAFVVMQVVGGALGYGFLRVLRAPSEATSR
jgi:glycerol uptake facilitator-like aquaporin